MTRLFLIAAAGLAIPLAACSKPDTPNPAPATSAAAAGTPAAPGDDMATMGMGAGAKMAKGEGKVTAVGDNSVTVEHGPIPEAGWPAMTMAFKAAPAVARQVKVGDSIAFDLKLQDGGGEITAVRKP